VSYSGVLFGGSVSHITDLWQQIFAAISARVVVWAASNVSSSSTKRWRVHSTLNLAGPATSLDFDSGRLLVGCGSSLQIWNLKDGRLWRESWKVEAPRPIRLCSFSPLGTSFAACSEEDRRVIVWQIKKAPLSRPRRTAILPHASYVVDMTWRGMPDTSR
jgi:WD40 repeat protein